MSALNLNTALAITADIYTPVLLIIALGDAVLRYRRGFKYHGLLLLQAVFVVYGWMFADKHFQWWSAVGWDYSTHTAAALALIICIALHRTIFLRVVLTVSLLVYGELMNLLGYHTWVDISTTAGVVVLTFAVLLSAQHLISRAFAMKSSPLSS